MLNEVEDWTLLRLSAPNWVNSFSTDLAVMWKQGRTTFKLWKECLRFTVIRSLVQKYTKIYVQRCPHTSGHMLPIFLYPNVLLLLFFQSSVTLPSTTSATLQYLSATRPSHSAILQSRLRPTTPRSNRDVPRFCSASPQTCTAAHPCWTSMTARLPTPAGHPANT